MTRVFASADSSAVAVGIDSVLTRLIDVARAQSGTLEIVRTGSRGLHWLEPLVEIERDGKRIAYGPLSLADVDARLLTGSDHPKVIGPLDEHVWFRKQKRLTFARCGLTDPLSLEQYRSLAGWTGLARARLIGREATIDAIMRSGLRGRGGAGFPAGIKWKTVAEAKGDRKYVVCNADEGDSGTFADRMMMEGDPFALIEGLIVAGFAIGASKGFVYARSEYPHCNATFRKALGIAKNAGLIGGDFDIELRIGAGSYVCGEETALLESLEGKRGQVRAKPPFPAHEGLFGAPTLVNNVLTLATVPWLLANGWEGYAALGFGKSRGTMPIQLSGNVRCGGLFEVPFGLTLREIVHEFGGGTVAGRPVKAVQCGGPLGAYFPEALLDTPYDYEAFASKDGLIGHGGVVVFDDTVDMAVQARFAMEFCAVESCGKCTPCRIGSVRGAEIIDRIVAGRGKPADERLLRDLCETLKFGSLCALGGFVPYPVLSALNHFPDDFSDSVVRRKAG
ncbi:MAG: NADH-ubiquinone oxidoreductase-F iron-sulfur binding region domain-containing protein [Micropepsaceae bacterium]